MYNHCRISFHPEVSEELGRLESPQESWRSWQCWSSLPCPSLFNLDSFFNASVLSYSSVSWWTFSSDLLIFWFSESCDDFLTPLLQTWNPHPYLHAPSGPPPFGHVWQMEAYRGEKEGFFLCVPLSVSDDREYKWRAYFAREARCMGNKCRTRYRLCGPHSGYRKCSSFYLVSIRETVCCKCR